MVMLIFNGSDLKRRNFCSPVHIHSINSQLIIGNLSFAVIAWALLISAGFILFNGYMFTANALLHLLNSFVFTLAALSISFLIANLVKSKGAVSAAANVVALGSSFLSGVFVPQYLLGDSVLTIASFTPTYWYVKSNNMITELANYRMENLFPILTNILIMLGFAVAVLAVTLVVLKQRRQSA
jgi:ABC-2 type transport system permease protein